MGEKLLKSAPIPALYFPALTLPFFAIGYLSTGNVYYDQYDGDVLEIDYKPKGSPKAHSAHHHGH